jgi:hypothetical protein
MVLFFVKYKMFRHRNPYSSFSEFSFKGKYTCYFLFSLISLHDSKLYHGL